MEHRLFGTVRLVVVVSTGSSLRGGAKESDPLGGWCLARCWVLKARAFFACSSVRALLAGRTALSPGFCWGLGLAPADSGVPPVF